MHLISKIICKISFCVHDCPVIGQNFFCVFSEGNVGVSSFNNIPVNLVLNEKKKSKNKKLFKKFSSNMTIQYTYSYLPTVSAYEIV